MRDQLSKRSIMIHFPILNNLLTNTLSKNVISYQEIQLCFYKSMQSNLQKLPWDCFEASPTHINKERMDQIMARMNVGRIVSNHYGMVMYTSLGQASDSRVMVLEMNEYGHNQEKFGSKNGHDEVMDWVIHTPRQHLKAPE